MRVTQLPMSVRIVIGACVLSLLVAGGTAYASIPDTNGLVHGCYSSNGAKATGGTQLNIIDSDSASCPKGQTAITWNGESPGSFAASAQSCSTGNFTTGIDPQGALLCDTPPPPKVYQATTNEGDGTQTSVPDGHENTIVVLGIPVGGTYLVSARLIVTEDDSIAFVTCKLHNSSDSGAVVDETPVVTPGDTSPTLELQGLVSFTGAGGATVTCQSAGGEAGFYSNRIDAVQVTAG
jgi:hypothetical protein